MSVLMRVNGTNLMEGMMKRVKKHPSVKSFKKMKLPVFSVKGATKTKKGF